MKSKTPRPPGYWSLVAAGEPFRLLFPLGAAIGLQPLPIAYFPWLAGTLLCYCLVAQLMKTVYIRRFGQWL